MKKIVKILALTVALLCVVSAFVACTAKSDKNDNNDKGSAGVEFYFTYEETKIELDKKADSVLSALGEANDEISLGDCGGFGTQTRYEYDNFDLYTVKNDSGESIDQITFSNDLVETSKGICIGDSSEKVLKAYGEPSVKKDDKIEYEEGSLLLQFSLEENGDVKGINYIRITSK